jgi:glycosyltransferase involved in cell wall biosynthesis
MFCTMTLAMTPQISIIVPAYNAEKYLAITLDSVLAQTFSCWELLIVNDGSADSTTAIAGRYAQSDPRIRLISQPNSGVSTARNLGFHQSNRNAAFLVFLDADDVWEPGALALLLETLNRHPEAPAAYGLARYVGKAGEPIEPGVCEGHQRFRLGLEKGRVIVWPPDRPTTFAVEAVMERVMTCGTVLIRRASFQKAGLFDSSLRMWEDWDYWLRLSRLGGLVFTDTLILGYRRHDTNVSGQRALLESGEWEVRRKLLKSVQGDRVYLPIARQGLAYRHRCAVSHYLHSAKSRCRERRPAAMAQDVVTAGKHLSQFMQIIFTGKEGRRLR